VIRASASQGVSRDKLIWTADAYTRPETYAAALARTIDAHHRLPIACQSGHNRRASGKYCCPGGRVKAELCDLYYLF
jgi:TnpA family transposase